MSLRAVLKDIRPIGVIKCRFKADAVNIYGLFLIIFNGRSRKILRFAAVSGCNPVIYETDIAHQWFSFERKIYSARLKDGSLREVTQEIERSLLINMFEQEGVGFYYYWDEQNFEGIKETIKQHISNVIKYDTGNKCEVGIEIAWQELNLRQFKYLSDTEKIDEEFKLHLNEDRTYSSIIDLNTRLVRTAEKSRTVKVEKIEAGDMVFTEIIDERDIGVYLAHLLGARSGEELVPLSANVEDVKHTPEGIAVIVRFGPGIVGRALEQSRKKISIIKDPVSKKNRWWYLLIIVFCIIIIYYVFFLK
ncbi:hypothetical protein ACFLTD_01325 [Elusimicrobiota bacterium]